MITWPWQRRSLPDGLRLPETELSDILSGLALCQGLSPWEQERLLLLAEKFLTDKTFEGVQGMVLEPWMAWTIALQACLSILNLGLKPLQALKSIILYQDDFLPPWQKADAIGVVHPPLPHQGESWHLGMVVLSWQAVLDTMGLGGPYGENVVLHEIAHQLDGGHRGCDGVPALPWSMSRSQWIKDFSLGYLALQKREKKGRYLPIDPYALESPAEFFAVVCEAFFLIPHELREFSPEIYDHLVHYFRQDPAQRWRSI